MVTTHVSVVCSHNANNTVFAGCIITDFSNTLIRGWSQPARVDKDTTDKCKYLCEQNPNCTYIYTRGRRCYTHNTYPYGSPESDRHENVWGTKRMCPTFGERGLVVNWDDQRHLRCELTVCSIDSSI